MATPLSPNPPRKGRPPNFVINDDGAPIFGLTAQAIRKGGEIIKHRYYATFSKPRVWFGFDRKLAIMRFRSWEAKQKDETIRISYPKRPSPAQRQQAEKWARKLDGKVIEFGSYDFSKIPSDILDRLVLIPETPGEPDWRFSIKVNAGDLSCRLKPESRNRYSGGVKTRIGTLEPPNRQGSRRDCESRWNRQAPRAVDWGQETW